MSNMPFNRLDDYGLVTFLKMKNYEVQIKNGIFEVRILPQTLEREISIYKTSPHKTFDDVGKQLKKMLKSSKEEQSKTSDKSFIQTPLDKPKS